VTYQSCWWADGVQERMPRVRFGQVHVVNNLFTCSGNNYCVRAGFEADLLVEGNVFRGVSTPIDLYRADYTAVTSRDNLCLGCTGNLSGSGTAFTPPYVLDVVPSGAVEGQVREKAGATLGDPECSTYLPPWVPPVPTAAPGPRGVLAASGAYPNPAGPGEEVRVDLQAEGAREVGWVVYTVSGRWVASGSLWLERRAIARWDLRDVRGRKVANGCYLWRLDDGGSNVVRKVVVLR
jgi:pectate lyase